MRRMSLSRIHRASPLQAGFWQRAPVQILRGLESCSAAGVPRLYALSANGLPIPNWYYGNVCPQDSSPEIVEEALRLGSGYVLKVNAAEPPAAITEILHGAKFVSSTVAKQRSATPGTHNTKPDPMIEDQAGTYRVDMDSPLPINLPEEEQIERILRGTFASDCNNVLARMYGPDSANDLIGKRMSDMVTPEDPRECGTYTPVHSRRLSGAAQEILGS